MKSNLPIVGALMTLLVTAHANADRFIEHEGDVNAPVAEVWRAWTTGDGFASWAVAKAEINFRLGGEMRSSYNPQSNLHDEHTIVNRILSFQTERMLSIQNVQAPAGFQNADLFQSTWTVIYFQPRSPLRTHVRIVGLGFGHGPEWDDLYRKFNAGNQWTLNKLCDKFAAADDVHADPDETMKLIHTLVGGEWIHENTKPDGSIFRARNRSEPGPGGHGLVSKVWLGNKDNMALHGDTQIWREPPSAQGKSAGTIRFQNINETGAIARGEIRMTAPRQLHWDWLASSPGGQVTTYDIAMTFIDDDHYQFTLNLHEDGGGRRELVNILYTRRRHEPEASTP